MYYKRILTLIIIILLFSSYISPVVAVLSIDEYQPDGVYLYYDTANIMGITERVKPDENGIPLIKRYDLGWQYNPTTISQYGLEQYSKYVKTGNLDNKNNSIGVANWLL